MKKFLLLIAISLACASSFSSAGKIYKWTDNDGNTHYGERPPGNNAKQIKVPKSTPNRAKNPVTSQEATKRLLDAIDKERKDKNEAKDKMAKEKARKDKNCSTAKRRVASLKLGGRRFEVDEQGERSYLSETEIQKRLVAAQKTKAEWCTKG
ncbi:MAG: DUF4124 domain-containing protein [Ectothiorhodospiraceae bacterium]|nr:DUF4124 domain-containing protein [Ectothiorhodospiraceae bacterium]